MEQGRIYMLWRQLARTGGNRGGVEHLVHRVCASTVADQDNKPVAVDPWADGSMHAAQHL
jgi:hypothetical protein